MKCKMSVIILPTTLGGRSQAFAVCSILSLCPDRSWRYPGLAVRPITISNANQYVDRPTDAALVLNTPFSLYRTIGKAVFVVPEYYQDEAEMASVYTPIHVPNDSVPMTKKNVVVRRSRLNQTFAYQIMAGMRHPSRDKLVQLCFGMRLDEEKASELLERGDCAALRPFVRRDVIIAFCLNLQAVA